MTPSLRALIIIPARYASTRFPGKPLVEIYGKPMVQHVYEKAVAVTDAVYVATDDDRIMDAVVAFGGRAIMTSADHQSGTDRCYEAYTRVAAQQGAFDVVVNVQGDEPFILAEQITTLVDCFATPGVEIATLAKSIERTEELVDSNKVKVVFSSQQRALYFSRSPIPFCRGEEPSQWLERAAYYKHIGMYAYRPEVLKAITRIPRTPLEQTESLEQLRWLESGYAIAVRLTDHESVGIDVPEDLARVPKK